MPLAIGILSILLAGMLGYLLRSHREEPNRNKLARLQTRDEDYLKAQDQLSDSAARIECLQQTVSKLEADLTNERRNTSEKIKLLEDSETRLKKEFENLAGKILADRSKSLSEQNREKLSILLQPFKEQMELFRKRVDQVHTEDTQRSAQLLTQVKLLQEASSKVSKDAENLAKAIKGDSKAQGDWGELIVQRIFEASGLEEGREYETQTSFRDEDGRLKRPDFVVNLPGGRIVIVDSKVSLTAYERFVNAEDEQTRDLNLKAHTLSVKKHIEELRGKDYQNLKGNRSLDFVIMCIPLEPAYQAALQADPNLICDISKTNVVLSGPSTLMTTLKLIGQIWRRENESRNAEVIADKAGKLYDKVMGIVEALEDTRKKFNGASKALDTALNRTASGSGNLVGKVEELRRLGAKTNKPLPKSYLAVSDNEEAPLQ